jgi:hypothetical protein
VLSVGREWIPSGAVSRRSDNTHTVSTPYLYIFGAYDVTYTQFRQDHFGLPADGAPVAPKHVGAS